MKSWVDTAGSALISGTAASFAMTAALALLAKKEDKGALQPIKPVPLDHWTCPTRDWGTEHIMCPLYSGR